MLGAQSSITGVGYTPASVNVGGQYANSSQYTNPAFTQFGQQQQQDLNLFSQVQGIGDANNTPPTLTSAPNPNAAAEEYLRQHEAGAIAQNSVANKYATLLSILGGTGK
jgi:hypothetical protein